MQAPIVSHSHLAALQEFNTTIQKGTTTSGETDYADSKDRQSQQELQLNQQQTLQQKQHLLLQRHNDTRLTTQEHNSSVQNMYIQSLVCHGCHHQSTKGSSVAKTCLAALNQLREDHYFRTKLTKREQYKLLSKQIPECQRCDPDSCNSMVSKIYWRYDSIPLTIINSTTFFLPSIPKRSRFPVTMFSNPSQHLHNLWNDPSRPKRIDLFFEFNPTLTPLPRTTLERLQVYDKYRPIYLASFRVSSQHACFPYVADMDEAQRVRMGRQNYLGLALLDKDLVVIPGSDVVIDIERQLKRNRYPSHNKYIDYRLFTFGETIFLNINGPPVHIVPLIISSANPIGDSSNNSNSGSEGIPLRTLFGNGLKVSLAHFPLRFVGITNGKNYALFRPDDLPNGHLLAELQTVGTKRMVQQIRVDDAYEKSVNASWDTIEDATVVGNITSTKHFGPRSYSTVDELWFSKSPFKKGLHGGACCIRMYRNETNTKPGRTGSARNTTNNNNNNNNNNNQTGTRSPFMFVGIAHNKVPFQKWMKKASQQELLRLNHHQYVSMLYAFEPTPPYNVVARSGYFCLPFPNNATTTLNPYVSLTRQTPLILNRTIFNCPKISFVSGMIEKVNDPTIVLLSYGINDCLSQVVQVSKQDIETLLFSKSMKYERISSQSTPPTTKK